MSEEEIIKKVDNFLDGERLYNTKTGETIIPYEYGECTRFVSKEYYEAIQGLLDLYQKEKELSLKRFKNLVKVQEKNKELMKPKYILNAETGKITKIDNEFISKDKIRELYNHYKDTGYYELESVLQELLEERN